MFDGKIGMWPFVVTRIARRSSSNQPVGTPETKEINWDKDTNRRFLIEMVVTAIKLRWPDQGLNRIVVIQYFGASCHIEGSNDE
jgi:hypothetical protein